MIRLGPLNIFRIRSFLRAISITVRLNINFQALNLQRLLLLFRKLVLTKRDLGTSEPKAVSNFNALL